MKYALIVWLTIFSEVDAPPKTSVYLRISGFNTERECSDWANGLLNNRHTFFKPVDAPALSRLSVECTRS